MLRPQIMHGICSLECGRQVFWIVLLAVMEAVTLRSLLSGWIVEDIPALQVVFAHLDDHSPRSLALHHCMMPGLLALAWKSVPVWTHPPPSLIALAAQICMLVQSCYCPGHRPLPNFLSLEPDAPAPPSPRTSRLVLAAPGQFASVFPVVSSGYCRHGALLCRWNTCSIRRRPFQFYFAVVYIHLLVDIYLVTSPLSCSMPR